MALSDDQRALLRLLAKREEGYEDIAALKGLSVEQVRAEVSDALAELQAAGEVSPPLPVETPQEPQEATPEPQEAKRPEPQPPESPAAAEAKAQPKSAARVPRPTLPSERRRLVLLTGGALGIVAVVLIAIAVFGGGSDSGSAGSSGAPAETAAETASGKVTQAVLEPAAGQSGSGQAVFGRLGKKIVLQVTAEGLKPTAAGESYTIWLYRTPKLTLRIGSVPVGQSGRLGARFTIPAELLAYVASGAFDQIYVSRTENAAYQREVALAKKNKSLPRYTGETVLTGEITGPIARQSPSR
jgi:hypothetical protein